MPAVGVSLGFLKILSLVGTTAPYIVPGHIIELSATEGALMMLVFQRHCPFYLLYLNFQYDLIISILSYSPWLFFT